MPDVKEMLESEFVTIDLVTNSPSKKATILGGGVKKPGIDGNERLVLPVEMDLKHKQYSPNKTTLQNLSKAWGTNTEAWMGKTVNLSITKIGGRDSILGIPVTTM